MSSKWYCCRQTAGPLVKECRALRPRFSKLDDAYTVKEKERVRRKMDSAVCHGPIDRLELLLALFGRDGIQYVCTFDDDYLPNDFKTVRKRIEAFYKRCRRWHKGSFDAVYAIEYGSQSCRYHVHFVMRDSDFPPAVVRHLWKYGWVDDSPVLKSTGGYRRLAKYFCKERSDGFFLPVGRHPWSCTRHLRAQLPDPQKWTDCSGVIPVPPKATWRSSPDGPQHFGNEFGSFYYYSYIL